MNTNAYCGSSLPRRDERSTINTRSKIWANKKCLSTSNHGASTEVTSSLADFPQKKQKVSLGRVLIYGNSNGLFEYDDNCKHNKNNQGSYSRSFSSESTTSISDEDTRDSDSNGLSTNDTLSSQSTTSSRSPSRLLPMTDFTDDCVASDNIDISQPKFSENQTIEPYFFIQLARFSQADNCTSTIKADRLECGDAGSRFDPHDDDSSDSVSSSASSRSHGSQSSSSSDMNKQTPSTEGDSQSQQSSTTSESDVNSNSKNGGDNGNTLLELFLRVTHDPEVALQMSRKLDGKLECAPPDHTEEFDSNGFSLLRHLELQDCSMIENKGEFTTCAAQSSSNSTPSNTVLASSSNAGINGGASGPPTKKDQLPSGEDRGQLTKSKKFEKSNNSQAIEPRPLRCFFNAMWPELYCVNQGTKKFRVCAGPGWNTIHHLKEHLKSHHKSKPTPLKCNRCQNEFRDQNSLKDHEVTIDCVIRCPDCEQEFDKKSLRQTHQQEAHCQETPDSSFLEYNESMEKLIKEQNKAYADSLKKGKMRSDAALEQWVDNNFAQYQVGRLAKHNPRLELGQWYIMCRTLSELGPNGKIPDHPFYNYGKTHSELVAEKILLIYENTIDTKLQLLGPPPSNLRDQRDWYKNNLRESLQIAAETRLIPPSTHDSSSSEQQQDFSTCITPQDSFAPDFSSGIGYDFSGMETPITTPHQSQHDQGIGNQQSDMVVTPMTYNMVPEHPEFLQSTSGSRVPSYDIYQFPNMPNAGEHFNGHFGINNLGNIDDNNSMDSINLPQDFISNRPQYPSNWHMQHRQ